MKRRGGGGGGGKGERKCSGRSAASLAGPFFLLEGSSFWGKVVAVVRSGWAEEEGEGEDKLKEKGEGKEEEEEDQKRRRKRTDRWRRADRWGGEGKGRGRKGRGAQNAVFRGEPNANKNKGRSSHSENCPRNWPLFAVSEEYRMEPISKSCFSTRKGQSGKCFLRKMVNASQRLQARGDIPRPTQAETFVGNIHREEISQARSGEREMRSELRATSFCIPERFISQN